MKTSVLGCAAAAIFCFAINARADFTGSTFDASMSYNTIVTTANQSPLVFRSDADLTNDALGSPANQWWGIESSEALGMFDQRVLSFDLFNLDASSIESGMAFDLDLTNLNDGSGLPWTIVGPIFISFTPQMSSVPTIELIEGPEWSQSNVGDSLYVSITITPEMVAPAGTFDAITAIDDVHITFAAIPEPATVLLLAGLVPCVIRRRRR